MTGKTHSGKRTKNNSRLKKAFEEAKKEFKKHPIKAEKFAAPKDVMDDLDLLAKHSRRIEELEEQVLKLRLVVGALASFCPTYQKMASAASEIEVLVKPC